MLSTCLEMFKFVSAEQTVAMHKTKLLKRVMLCYFAAEAAKELSTL